MIKTAVLGEIFFLFFTLSVAASQEDCVPQTERAYPPTLLKKQPLPTKIRLTALGGKSVPVTEKDIKNFTRFTNRYCKKPEKIADSAQAFMALDKKAAATFIGLIPFFKLPHEFLTHFLTACAENVLKNDTIANNLFFDSFYSRLLSPVKNFFISYEKQPNWSKNLKIIGIGGQDKKLIFGAENSHKLEFLDSSGNSIYESMITKEPFEVELQKQLYQTMTRTFASESKILINKDGTTALIDQQKRLEDFDNMLTNNLSSWQDDEKETLKDDGVVTEDYADITTSRSLSFINFTNKNDTCLEKEKDLPTIKRPGGFSFRPPSDNKWVYALSNNGAVALYKNSFFVHLYKKDKMSNNHDLIDIKKDSKIEKMVFNTDGSLLAIYAKDLHIWQQKSHKKYTTWQEVFTKTIPNISDISFNPKGRACLVASHTKGAYYISLATKKPKIFRLTCANIGFSRVFFCPDGRAFATIGLDRSIRIYCLPYNKNKPLLLSKFSPKQNATWCGNEAFLDAKFSPYEKNTLVFATEGGWIASWNYMTGKIENFLAYDGLSPTLRIKELFILGPRHILLWLEDGSIKELFALSPRAFFVYQTLTKNNKISLTVPNRAKDYKKAPSLFNAHEKINQEFEDIGFPLRIKYKRPKNIESSFELYF